MSCLNARWTTPSDEAAASCRTPRVVERSGPDLGPRPPQDPGRRVGAGQPDDLVTGRDQVGDEPATDPAGRSGDEDTHGNLQGLVSCTIVLEIITSTVVQEMSKGGGDGRTAHRPPAAGRPARRGGRLHGRTTASPTCRGGRSPPPSGSRPPRWSTTSAPRSRCWRPSSGGCASGSSRRPATRRASGPTSATAARTVWTRTSSLEREPEFRLFFAVYGRALQAPRQFTAFLDHVVADWMAALVDAQGPASRPGDGGAHRDPGDRDDPRPPARPARHRRPGDQVQAAAESFLATLEQR